MYFCLVRQFLSKYVYKLTIYKGEKSLCLVLFCIFVMWIKPMLIGEGGGQLAASDVAIIRLKALGWGAHAF